MRTRVFVRLAVATIAATLAGCATWHALPLDNGRGPRRIADLAVPAGSMPTPTLRAYTFDPANGLDVTEVAMLAVANNPQLRIARDRAGLAHAQAYAAGLLPDPRWSYQHERPTGQQPDATDSFTAGWSLDLGNLVTRSARVASARAGAREVDLDLLWDEWQTIAQARTLFDRMYFARKLVARLQRERDALAPVHGAIEVALQRGDLDYASATAGLNAASDVASQLADATRQLNQAEHGLHEVLGLDAAVPLHLGGAPFSIDPDQAEVQRALTTMPTRRPDLLALRAGYESQQQDLRTAVLAQFPAITIGFVRDRDNSNISSRGFSISMSLPLFDGNRGNLAIGRATRRQLHDVYAARLLTDRNDVQRLFADLLSDRMQRRTLAAHAAQLDRARETARTDYAAGRLEWPTWLAIRASSLGADTALLALDENTHATAIALDALVGNWPDTTLAGNGQTAVVRK